MKRKQQGHRKGFTLVELLVVVAIMGILIAFTVPAFESMGRGSAVRTAATQLAATMTYARQQAVVTRANTYVVFPHLDSTLYAGSLADADKALRSYNVYSEKYGYLRNWTYLPKGVVFVNRFSDFSHPIVRDTKSIFANDPQLNPKVTASIRFPTTNNTVKSVKVIGFAPDGGMFSVNGNLRGPDAEILLTEGIVPLLPSGLPDTPDYRSVSNSSLYAVLLNPLTGQSKIVDFRYF